MTEPDEVILWISRAEEDFLLALSALRRKKPLTYGATFHSQQCAEKYLKALLTHNGISFPRTHDLVALSNLFNQNNIILPVSDDDLDKLAAYAVEVRYPGKQPNPDEAREAWQIAKNLRRFTRKLLGL